MSSVLRRIAVGRATLLFVLTTLTLSGSARAQLPLEVLHSFAGDTNPSGAQGPLIQATDGSFYGTTGRGGTFGEGTVFRATSAGQVTVLHSFGGGEQGSEPQAGVIQARDGNFYGTTLWGGRSPSCPWTLGCGTVFRMTPRGAVTQLHVFGTSDGYSLYAGLVEANDGNLYGVATQGGAHGKGTVFRITPAGAFAVLHSFSGPATLGEPAQPGDIDGAYPYARLIQAADGSLYGTTFYGGANRVGTVFRISLHGAVTTMHSFGPADGALPQSGVVQASDGNFYGATTAGYVSGSVLYRMTPAGSVTVLHNLGHRDFFNDATMIQASDGHLYGVTEESIDGGLFGFGFIFRLTLDGAFSRVHTFTFDEGYTARGSLLQAVDGHLYGTTLRGGMGAGNGSIFRSTLGGSFSVLSSFTAGPEGGFPTGELFQAPDQFFFGTTISGGTFGNGTVYRMSPGGATTTMYAFGRADGRPEGGVIQGRDGNLYGTTSGGYPSSGTVWRLTPGGAFSVVHTFSGGPDGSSPSTLLQAADGNFYGTTAYANNSVTSGTVFRITPSGLFTTLHTFNGADGAVPSALVQGTDGTFYGTTSAGGVANRGTVFRMTPEGAVTVLHAFKGLVVITDDDTGQFISSSGDPGDGAAPLASLIQATDGSFYGTTYQGGERGRGVLFSVTPQGQFTLLHSFGAPEDAAYPSLPLVQAVDGALYGTTSQGGVHGIGTIFRMAPGGAVTVLHAFSGRADGQYPLGGLTQGRDGYLYGTTSRAGRGGQAFRFLPAGAFVPRILFGTAAAGGGLALAWASDPGAGPFTITRTGGAEGQTTVASGVAGNTFTDRTVVPGVVYSYVVTATPAGGGSVSSAAVAIPWLSPVSRTPTVTTVGDYDGDGKADLTVYRGSTGEWFTHRSADGALSTDAWGAPVMRDRPVPADYDGDGVTDLAVYRQTNADWRVQRSSDGGLTLVAWGAPGLGDLPVPADYDGDGRADIAVYRATTGEWFILRSTDHALERHGWGSPGLGDVPVPADYDGDRRADLAVYRATTGEWLLHRSTDGALEQHGWGSPGLGDVPVPADYDGDRRTDLAVYRAATGEWFLHRSTDGALVQFRWGAPLLGDVPVVGDYDGDGRAEVAVYRESTGQWFIVGSSAGLSWGAPSLGDAVRSF